MMLVCLDESGGSLMSTFPRSHHKKVAEPHFLRHGSLTLSLQQRNFHRCQTLPAGRGVHGRLHVQKLRPLAPSQESTGSSIYQLPWKMLTLPGWPCHLFSGVSCTFPLL